LAIYWLFTKTINQIYGFVNYRKKENDLVRRFIYSDAFRANNQWLIWIKKAQALLPTL